MENVLHKLIRQICYHFIIIICVISRDDELVPSKIRNIKSAPARQNTFWLNKSGNLNQFIDLLKQFLAPTNLYHLNYQKADF